VFDIYYEEAQHRSIKFFYEISHECRLSENFDACVVENDGSDLRLRRTAGERLYLMFACDKSSLNTFMMFTLSFAEHST
jgi:hypothetical protein